MAAHWLQFTQWLRFVRQHQLISSTSAVRLKGSEFLRAAAQALYSRSVKRNSRQRGLPVEVRFQPDVTTSVAPTQMPSQGTRQPRPELARPREVLCFALEVRGRRRCLRQ